MSAFRHVSRFSVFLLATLLAYVLWYLVASLRVCYAEGWGKSALKAFGVMLLFLPVLGVSIEIASDWGAGNGDAVVRMIKD